MFTTAGAARLTTGAKLRLISLEFNGTRVSANNTNGNDKLTKTQTRMAYILKSSNFF
jgi:hypothetical protein